MWATISPLITKNPPEMFEKNWQFGSEFAWLLYLELQYRVQCCQILIFEFQRIFSSHHHLSICLKEVSIAVENLREGMKGTTQYFSKNKNGFQKCLFLLVSSDHEGITHSKAGENEHTGGPYPQLRNNLSSCPVVACDGGTEGCCPRFNGHGKAFLELLYPLEKKPSSRALNLHCNCFHCCGRTLRLGAKRRDCNEAFSNWKTHKFERYTESILTLGTTCINLIKCALNKIRKWSNGRKRWSEKDPNTLTLCLKWAARSRSKSRRCLYLRNSLRTTAVKVIDMQARSTMCSFESYILSLLFLLKSTHHIEKKDKLQVPLLKSTEAHCLLPFTVSHLLVWSSFFSFVPISEKAKTPI